MNSEEASEYLIRIGYTDAIHSDLSSLHQLQHRHLLTVPFENLDIHYGQKIELDTSKFYQKIVRSKRGGFCYELNELFGQLLLYLGYQVKRVSARVYDDRSGYGEEYDHLALIIHLEGIDYLVDVGFGEFASTPIEIKIESVHSDPRGQFSIDHYDQNYIRICKLEIGKKNPQYIFKPRHRDLFEFKLKCLYHQTSEQSHFTKKKMISLMTHEGRITLTDQKLKILKNGKKNEVLIRSESEFLKYLRHYFSIELMESN